jgi:hypothetical protein
MHTKCKVGLLLSALLLSVSLGAQENQLSVTEKAEGWELLFNGHDVSQWRNFKQEVLNNKWQAVQGELTLTAKDAGDIVSKKQYADFELKLDWRISAVGNSGILLRADESGDYIYSHAVEVQILDNERHPDSKLTTRRSGSLYDLQASPPQSHKPAEEWNHVRIVFKGRQLQVWQNEVQTVDMLIGSEDWNARLAKSKFKTWPDFGVNRVGFIGLQDHGDVVAFKNLKIKTL